MATKKTDGGGSIRYDEFVKQVRPDPKQTEPISILHGYVGAGVTDDTVRLYADETLSEYVDVAKADILYSIPNEEDLLGGSKVWVKQNASVKYADGNAFAQGSMYDDYMGNMYDGSYGNMAAGPITQICTVQPTLLTRNVICRPTRFICPTPVSRLIICNFTRNCTIQPTLLTRNGCPQPSLVDGCPSALGCTIDRTVVINPGVVRPNEFSGGDMYNDYMQNMYEPDGGGQSNFGPGTIGATIVQTSPVICQFTPVTLRPNCLVTFKADCFRTINPRDCPITCSYRTRIDIFTLRCPVRTLACATDFTRPATIFVSVACPSIACATDFTRPQTIFTVAGGGIGRMDDDTSTNFGTGDYGTGDMYNSYMQNDYTAEGMAGGFNPDTTTINPAIPQPTAPIICHRPPITVPVQICGGITQVWNTRCCPTRFGNPPCTITLPSRCCPSRHIHCASWVQICHPRTFICDRQF
jgi:hypothetical protein